MNWNSAIIGFTCIISYLVVFICFIPLMMRKSVDLRDFDNNVDRLPFKEAMSTTTVLCSFAVSVAITIPLLLDQILDLCCNGFGFQCSLAVVSKVIFLSSALIPDAFILYVIVNYTSYNLNVILIVCVMRFFSFGSWNGLRIFVTRISDLK